MLESRSPEEGQHMSSIRSVLSRFRWLPILAAAGLLIVQGPPAEAAASGAGNDISWPQCGRTLPTGQAFGIVGVNNGLANTTNPCLATELSWAGNSKGTTLQPKTALYVNTANPGQPAAGGPAA